MMRLVWLHIAILVAGSALLIGDPAAAQRHPFAVGGQEAISNTTCLLYTSPSPRDRQKSRMPSSA